MTTSPPCVLLTGAGGFIGRHLWRFLQEKGYRVLAMVNSPETPACELAGEGDTLVCGRLPDIPLEAYLAEKPAYCVHLAGGASVPASLADPATDFYNSVVATEALLSALSLHSQDTKVLFLSSAAVYGNPACLPVSETCLIDPISPYGHHKRMAELVCQKYNQLYGQPMTILRPFSVYGPGLRKQLFWEMYGKWKAHGEVALFGDGQESRDFLHVRDLLTAVHLSMLGAGFHGEAINVASGVETTIQGAAALFLKALEAETGQPIPLRFTGEMKPGDPARWQVDVARLRALGSFSPIPLEDGLAETARWMVQQDQ